jgi:hypothetical protein
LYREKVTGAHNDRRELLKMLKHIAPGDVVTVTRIDRLARSTFDLFAIVKQIVDAKAQFRSLAEPWADTGTSTGRLMLAVLGGLADVERDLIRTRTAIPKHGNLLRGYLSIYGLLALYFFSYRDGFKRPRFCVVTRQEFFVVTRQETAHRVKVPLTSRTPVPQSPKPQPARCLLTARVATSTRTFNRFPEWGDYATCSCPPRRARTTIYRKWASGDEQ